MNMSITGGSKSQKELITNVSHWVANKVLGPRLSRVVNIDYIITRKLDADGWCIWEDKNTYPREFSIELRFEQSYTEMILTVCHEMVHVRQMARGELKDVSMSRDSKYSHQTWKGKKMRRNIAYAKQPWETEAYKLQETLAEMFIEETNFIYTKSMQRRDKYIGNNDNDRRCHH